MYDSTKLRAKKLGVSQVPSAGKPKIIFFVRRFIYDFLILQGNFGLEITYRKERTRRNLRRKRKSREYNRTI